MSTRRSRRKVKPVTQFVPMTSFKSSTPTKRDKSSPAAKENRAASSNSRQKGSASKRAKLQTAANGKSKSSTSKRSRRRRSSRVVDDEDDAASDDSADDSSVEDADEDGGSDADDDVVASDEDEHDVEVDNADEDADEVSGPRCQRLFREFLLQSKPQNVVRAWLQRYGTHDTVAMEEVAAFCLYSCVGLDAEYDDAIEGVAGCVEDGVEGVIESMNAVGDAAVFYPLVANSKLAHLKKYKKFGTRLATFWATFLAAVNAGTDAETGHDITTQCFSWLTAISSAKNRALRHTATFSAFALAKALAKQCAAVQRQLSNNQTRLKAERRSSSNKNHPRARKLADAVQADKDRINDTNKVMDSVFKGIFMHRAQDVDWHIREATVTNFAELVVAYKKYFLKEKFLQHFLHAIEDKDTRVRVAGIRGVAAIYHSVDEDEFEAIEMFKDRFHDKAGERFADNAPGMMNAMLDLCFELDAKEELPQEFLDAALSAILLQDGTNGERAVSASARRRAARLVIEYNSELKSANKSQQLSAFISFCAGQTSRESVANCDVLVAAFFELIPVLKDFTPMVERLLDDASDASSSTTAILLRVLFASAKHAQAQAQKPKLSKPKKEHYTSILCEFTSATVAHYDKLATRFASEPEFASYILELPQLMVAESFSSKGEHFKRMCKSLRSLFLRLSNTDSLRQISSSFSALMAACDQTAPREHTELQTTVSSLASALDKASSPLLSEATEAAVSGTKAVDEDTLVNVTAALRRLKYLFMHSDVRNDLSDPKAFVANLYTFVEAATERLSESGNANVEEVQAASEALITAHFWFLHTWAECFSNLCSVFSSEDAKPNISRFERLVDEFVATRAPYLACLRLIIEAKPSDEDDLTPDQVEPLKCLQRQAWKQTMEVWLANNQSVAMDRTEARPLRFPYANDENFTVALANVFTEWMEDPVVETDREALVAGCDNSPAARFDAFKTQAQIVLANAGSFPTLQGGVLFAQYANASKHEKELIKKVSRRWAHGNARDHVQLIKCQMSALRHKFDIFRAAIDTTDEALRETYTDLVGLSHSLSRLVVGVGKLTKQPASLKEAFTSFMEQGLKFAFSGVETGSLATLYFVDVLDEYIPRLDDDMLNSFRSFVQEEASSCGVLTQYAEAVAAEDVETDSGIWKAFSDFMDKVGIAVGDSEAPKSRKTVRRRNAPGGNKRAKKQPSRRQRRKALDLDTLSSDEDEIEESDEEPAPRAKSRKRGSSNAQNRSDSGDSDEAQEDIDEVDDEVDSDDDPIEETQPQDRSPHKRLRR